MEFIKDCAKTPTVEMDYLRFGTGPVTVSVIPGVSITKVSNYGKALCMQFRNYLDQFTFYVFDRKNNMEAGYTVEEMAEDTATVMKHLGISKTCLYGASQGGMICQVIAANHPELVIKAAIVSTSSRLCPSFQKVANQWIAFSKEGNIPALNQSFGENLYQPQTLALWGDYTHIMNKNATREDLDRFILQVEASQNTDHLLSKIHCPVFVLGGCEDKVFEKEESEYIAQKLNCRLKLYENSGHAMYDENPNVLKEAMEFLAET